MDFDGAVFQLEMSELGSLMWIPIPYQVIPTSPVPWNK